MNVHDPGSVAVSFDPRSLSAAEGWRLFLTRLWPGSGRPVARAIAANAYLILSLAFLGHLAEGSATPGLPPGLLTGGFAAIALLFPVRMYRARCVAIRTLSAVGPIGVAADGAGLTLRSRHRVTRVEWAGVLDVRASADEVVIRYQAGDASWIPLRAFPDFESEARFLATVRSGLAGTG